MSNKVHIGWIQGKSQGSIEANKKYYLEKIREASKNGTKLIVLPELFLSDYFAIEERKESFDLAVFLDDEILADFKVLAKELKVYLVLPIFEKNKEGDFYNSILLIDENGELKSHYRKMHIPYDPGFYEKFYFSPGDKDFVVSELPFCNLGLLICWDQWFPEAARINVLKGANLLIYPTAIAWDAKEPESVYEEQLDAWVTMMRSHAISNHVHVLAVNRVGKEGHLTFWGNSFLVNPYGKVLVRNGLEEEVSSLEIDLSVTDEAREIWPFFRDRRTDKYEPLLKGLE